MGFVLDCAWIHNLTDGMELLSFCSKPTYCYISLSRKHCCCLECTGIGWIWELVRHPFLPLNTPSMLKLCYMTVIAPLPPENTSQEWDCFLSLSNEWWINVGNAGVARIKSTDENESFSLCGALEHVNTLTPILMLSFIYWMLKNVLSAC